MCFIVSTPINKKLKIYNNFICETREVAEEVAEQFKEACIEKEGNEEN